MLDEVKPGTKVTVNVRECRCAYCPDPSVEYEGVFMYKDEDDDVWLLTKAGPVLLQARKISSASWRDT